MKIVIPRNRFLKNLFLESDGESFIWKDSIDKNSYILGDKTSSRSINPIFQILGTTPPLLISKEVKNSYSLLGAKENLPIDAVQSSEEMIGNIKNSFRASREALKELEDHGYLDTFMETNQVIQRLQRAQIDYNGLRQAIEDKDIRNISVSKTFFPQKDGFLKVPKYSLTRTLTGRMTITDGPQILTAPKKIRKYLKSSFPNGKICQIDFISLEPRVGMLLNEEDLGEDIYEYLGKKLFSQKVARATVKKLVLCAVYGASEATIKRSIPEGMNVRQLINRAKEILNYDLVVKEQTHNYQKTGKIKNFFGRPIQPQDNRDSLLYNNYIQSTAVDVALLGFGKILKQAPARVRPIFFIHDAMLVDLHPDDIENFKNVSKSIFIEGLGRFPLEFQVLG